VDVYKPGVGYSGFAAGLSPRHPKEPMTFRAVFQDGAAPTYIVNPIAPFPEMGILGYFLQAIAYVGYERPRVLVIGAGGGVDIAMALHYGAEHVVGVEVNPATVELLQAKYASGSGYLASRPDVELRVAEGRHFLTADPRKFDVIQLSGVDTFTALSSGAYALTENYLYTVEAMHDLLDHLETGGVLSIARWLFEPPRETLRLVSTQLQALAERGIDDTRGRFVIVRGSPTVGLFRWAETLVKNEPFTREEVERYRRWAEEREFTVVYDPFNPRENVFDRLIRSEPEARARILDEYPYDVSPSTDDNPFFFQFYRWRNLFLGEFLNPGVASVPESPRRVRRTPRLGEVPVGLLILFSSVVFIVVLSALFIATPLVGGAGSLRGVPWKLGVFSYFGLVGLGFMFVEIVLLQRLTVFVGGPTYSMSITLAALLFFTGVGAALSRVVQGRLSLKLAGVITGLGLVLGGEYLFLKHGIPALLGLSHAARCGVAVAAIAPMGLCLGMPFPVGLRLLDGIDRRLVPWAYGINGCASVLGGMVCIVLSMAAGLSTAWGAAVLFYLAAAGVLLTAPRGGAA
jgi:spermidine synthase